MKIGIIGAGFTGLSAAYYLTAKGHDVTILEKDPHPGGLAIGYQEKGWDWTLEKFYHHWFTNDKAILDLAKEINYPVITKRPKTSSFIDGKVYQLDSPLTLLTFKKLSIAERLRMGIVLAFLRYNPYWKPLEGYTAASFLSKTVGEKTYKKLWEPLLIGKFGDYTNIISLAWFWSRIAKRTTKLAYPEGGFLQFAQALDTKVRAQNGNIYYNTSVESITTNNNTVSLGKKYQTFDKVIVTLPSFAFLKLAPQLPVSYQQKLMQLKGIGAVVMVMRLKEKFFNDDTYWLSVCDTKLPVLAVVEHTNYMNRKHYNNEHIVYLGNYLPKDHPYFSMSEDELLKKFDPFLKTLQPQYKKSLIGLKKFSVPFAQPIIPTHYSNMIPPFKTPLQNVYLANMQQVYPWDRGTNYAVELGERVSKLVVSNIDS